MAEETGLIHPVGEWVCTEVCRQLRRWRETRVPFNGYIAINVSAWQFANPDFVSQLTETMAQHRVESQQIVLELTETALLYDIQETIDKLTQFRSLGIRVALDDFGTGYSSLAYLKDMSMDVLKIDKAFIHELTTTNAYPLVETIIAMGQHMGLDVIAEGVETEPQRRILLELGCKAFQGYLFARPMPEHDFLAWLQHTPATEKRQHKQA